MGVESILKAWHLYLFGAFDRTHKLVLIYNKIKEKDQSIEIGKRSEKLLVDLDKFYRLRYPKIDEPTEVGSDQLRDIDQLLKILWNAMPQELIDTYSNIDSHRKGNRILMRKRITDESPAIGLIEEDQ